MIEKLKTNKAGVIRADLKKLVGRRKKKVKKLGGKQGGKMVCEERKDIRVVEQKKNERGWPEKVM